MNKTERQQSLLENYMIKKKELRRLVKPARILRNQLINMIFAVRDMLV